MSNLTIEQRVNDRNNNLDLIRFIAAALVIYSHSFPLGAGDNSGEIVLRATSGKWDAGALAVATFFVISGFLITQSYERSNSLGDFLKARILRIFPGLAATLLFGAFIIGPIFTSLPVKQYLLDRQTYDYLKSFFIIINPLRWNLPGLFQNNVYIGSVNGSLWTIPFEFICYLIVALLGLMGLLRYRNFVLFIFFITVYYNLFYSEISLGFTHLFGLEIKKILELFCYFSAGMIIYLYRGKIPINKYLAMICLTMLGFSFLFGGAKELFIIFGSYLIFYLAYTPEIKYSQFSKFGDFSYGLYIYAFPVQQTVTHIYGGRMAAGYNFIISFFITLLLAVLSWHIIEKPALKLKKVSFNNFLFPKAKLNNYFKQFNYVNLEKAFRMNWPVFIIVFIVLFIGLGLYNQKPSRITFPYEKNNNIFQGGWLPQSLSENYRWISNNGTVVLQKPSHANNLVIEGFIPENFTEVNRLLVYINNVKISDINIKPGNPLSINSAINVNEKMLKITLEFNDSHKPKQSDPDQRQMSALINKIEIR